MTFIEFKRRDGTRFLIDFASHWEIDDKGNKPALWGNHEQGRNMDCAETYEQVRAKLLEPTQPAAQTAPAALKHPAVKSDMLVNGGALKLALNVLRRAGKNEVADELECTAQAAPVDAERWLDLLAEARAALWQPANAALCERLDAFIDAARAAQKDTND